jgi:hypothetical protein
MHIVTAEYLDLLGKSPYALGSKAYLRRRFLAGDI